jgi:hypothetical protein
MSIQNSMILIATHKHFQNQTASLSSRKRSNGAQTFNMMKRNRNIVNEYIT